MVVWLLLIVLAFCTGLSNWSWWTAFVWPAVSLGIGVWAVASEPTNYDMHGFGYYVGAFLALVCLLAWLLGRGLAAVARRTRAGHSFD